MRTDLRQFRTLARNWEAFAKADPLFGVLSDPTKIGGEWDLDEFFGSGHAHVRKLLRILHDLDVAFVPGACLDFGCGVGRLTIPLSASFERTIGVDIAKSMLETARIHLKPGDRCEFVRNRHPDLRLFAEATFDVVHTCLVLQHIPPAVSLRYIGEFLRVAKPGGLALFQVPAETISEETLTARYALPDSGYSARLELAGVPERLEAGERVTVTVTVANTSTSTWRHDIPAGRHICIANHWLRRDGTVLMPDDGRAYLPETLAPGASIDVPLLVQAPSLAGDCQLEVDLVQERICWFAEKGSRTARVAVLVTPPTLPPVPAATPVPSPAPRFLERLRQRFRRGTPAFEMHVVPRDQVERAIATAGGQLLHAIDDNAAGDRWLSYTYVCRKL